MSRSIGAIIIFGQDIAGLAKWYQEIVGFDKPEGFGEDHAGLMVGDIYVGFDKKSPAPAPGSIELYFAVEDVDAAYAEAKRKGGQVHSAPADKEYGRDCSFTDPAGNHVWLWKAKG